MHIMAQKFISYLKKCEEKEPLCAFDLICLWCSIFQFFKLDGETNQDYTYFLFALLTSVIETVALIVYFTTRFARTKFIKLKNRNRI